MIKKVNRVSKVYKVNRVDNVNGVIKINKYPVLKLNYGKRRIENQTYGTAANCCL